MSPPWRTVGGSGLGSQRGVWVRGGWGHKAGVPGLWTARNWTGQGGGIKGMQETAGGALVPEVMDGPGVIRVRRMEVVARESPAHLR